MFLPLGAVHCVFIGLLAQLIQVWTPTRQKQHKASLYSLNRSGSHHIRSGRSCTEDATQKTPLTLSLPCVFTNTTVGKMHLEAEKLWWVQLQWGWRLEGDVSPQSYWMRMRRLANGITESVWMCFCSTPVLGASAQHGGGLCFSPLHWFLLHLLLLSSLFVHTPMNIKQLKNIKPSCIFQCVNSSDHCRGTDLHMNSCENLLQVS